MGVDRDVNGDRLVSEQQKPWVELRERLDQWVAEAVLVLPAMEVVQLLQRPAARLEAARFGEKVDATDTSPLPPQMFGRAWNGRS